MDAGAFLEVANQLLAGKLRSSSPEAENRTAISRAYYALFNTVSQYLRRYKISFKSTFNSHIKVVEALRDTTNDDVISIAEEMDGLRVVRQDADYDLDYDGSSRNNAKIEVSRAQLAISNFKKFDSSDEIAKAVKDHLVKTNQTNLLK
jgi:uncharacterized protein (UPF0332 family)